MEKWKACSVSDCTNTGQLIRGWCKSHYARWLRYGDVQAAVPLKRKTTHGLKVCTIPECGRPHLTHGWCSTHYARWRTKGDPGDANLLRTPGDPDLSEKRCTRCRLVKPIGEFYFEKRNRDDRGAWCKPCNGHETRRREYMRKYGITITQYNDMVAAQGGLCAVCSERPPKLVIDHCHKSGSVRALLCNRCNILLGVADDRPDLLNAALSFLGRHTTT